MSTHLFGKGRRNLSVHMTLGMHAELQTLAKESNMGACQYARLILAEAVEKRVVFTTTQLTQLTQPKSEKVICRMSTGLRSQIDAAAAAAGRPAADIVREALEGYLTTPLNPNPNPKE